MEIFGEIKTDDEKTGYIGFRKEAWETNAEEQRLIIKTFTEDINWIASMEELVAPGYARSMASERSTPAFTINVSKHEPLITLEATIPREIWPGDTYNFYLFNPEQKVLNLFRIREDRFTVGSDWNVNDVTQTKVARINGHALNVGGKYTVDIYDEQLAKDHVFANVLILFAGMLKFRRLLDKRMDSMLEKMQKKKTFIKISKEEARLYDNPRRLAY